MGTFSGLIQRVIVTVRQWYSRWARPGRHHSETMVLATELNRVVITVRQWYYRWAGPGRHYSETMVLSLTWTGSSSLWDNGILSLSWTGSSSQRDIGTSHWAVSPKSIFGCTSSSSARWLWAEVLKVSNQWPLEWVFQFVRYQCFEVLSMFS